MADIHPRHLLPDFILDQLRSHPGEGPVTGRFEAVAVFVDMSGFTAMTEAMFAHGSEGAEVLSDVIGAVFDPLISSIYRHGGFVIGFAGDAFTAIFPTEPERAPRARQAVAAAAQIQMRLVNQPPVETRFGRFEISGKVGAALGQVAWGILTNHDGSQATYYFRGEAINGAALAEHQAAQGDLILDPALSGQVADAIDGQSERGFFHVRRCKIMGFEADPPRLAAADIAALAPPFVPPELLIREQTGEFRQVLSLFISLPGEPDHDELLQFARRLFGLQAQYGGFLNRIDFGDKGCNLLLFWGAPTAHENDVQRALSLVRELQAQMERPLRAGITYALVHAGFAGSRLREEYTCYGRGVNLAARLMMAAPFGEVWLDEAAAARARGFTTTLIGHRPFKGFANALPVYFLGQQRSEAPAFSGRLIGREKELAVIRDFLAPLADGRGPGLLQLTGEAGIGKSHLIQAALAEMQADERVTVLLCQADELHSEFLGAFRYSLRRYFRQDPAADEAANKAAFEECLAELSAAAPAFAAELTRTASILGALLDLFWPDSLYANLPPKLRYENSLTAIINLLLAEADRQPLIIQLEDAHWLDADSWQLLATLLPQAAAMPVAVLATARPEEAVLARSMPALRTHFLGPLSTDSLAALAADMLGGTVSPELLALVVERADGNPFFAEQILLYLQEQGAVSAGRLPAERAMTLPDDVRAILVARLDRLSENVRHVVQTAAILGREFELSLLQRMLKHDAALAKKVATATESSIWQALSEIRYIFKHALLRDAAYSMQLLARRQQLHRLAAVSLEVLFRHDLAPHFPDLAYHFEMADIAPEAAFYLEKSGDAAADAYQNGAALAYYQRLVTILADDSVVPFPPDLLLEARIKQGNIQLRMGDWPKAWAVFHEVYDRAKHEGAPALQARALERLGRLAELQADYEPALEYLDLAQVHYEALGEKNEQILIFNRISGVYWRQGDHEKGLAAGEAALRLAQSIDDDLGIARACSNIGTVYFYKGEFGAARTYYLESLRRFERLGDKEGLASTWSNLASMYLRQGDHPQALDAYDRALSLYREIGSQAGVGNLLGNRANLYRHRGEFDAALDGYRSAMTLFSQIGNKWGYAIHTGNIAALYKAQGRLDLALPQSEEAIAQMEAIGAQPPLAWQLTVKSEILLALGQRSAAAAAAAAGRSLAERLQSRTYLWRLRLVQAQAAYGSGDPAGALADVEALLAEFTKPEEQAAIHFTYWRLTGDAEHGAAARALYDELLAQTPLYVYRERLAQLNGR